MPQKYPSTDQPVALFGIGKLHRNGLEPELATDSRKRLVDRAQSEKRAKQGDRTEHRQQPPRLLAALLSRPPQLQCGQDPRAAEQEQVCAAVGTSAELDPRPFRLRQAIHQVALFDDADGDVALPSEAQEVLDHVAAEQRVIRSRHQ